MKKYAKPDVSVFSFSQKEHVAADCRFCYAGYENDACETDTVCWVDGDTVCIPEDWPAYGVG